MPVGFDEEPGLYRIVGVGRDGSLTVFGDVDPASVSVVSVRMVLPGDAGGKGRQNRRRATPSGAAWPAPKVADRARLSGPDEANGDFTEDGAGAG